MTTFQKTLTTITLAASIGTTVYQPREASDLRSQTEKLRRHEAALAGEIQSLAHERDDATSRLVHGLLACVSPSHRDNGITLLSFDT
jgi:hypothetical protein